MPTRPPVFFIFDRAGIEIPFPHQVVVGEGSLRREPPPTPAVGDAPRPAGA